MLFKGTSVSWIRVPLFTVDIDAVCQMNKTAIVANPFNCAQYYDCSKQVSAFGKPYLQECKYPDLFSSGTNSCEPFTSVTGSCGRRKEAQAPCKTLYLFSYLPSGIIWNAIIYIYRNIYYIYQKFNIATGHSCLPLDNYQLIISYCLDRVFAGDYVQNKCNSTDPTCEPCPKRLPSCVGLPDGKQIFPGKQLAPDYIECQQNRTMEVKKCHLQYFNPQMKDCKNYSRRKYHCIKMSTFCLLTFCQHFDF